MDEKEQLRVYRELSKVWNRAKGPPAILSPLDVAKLDLHPADDGTIRLGPYVYRWKEKDEAWMRVKDLGKVPKRGGKP